MTDSNKDRSTNITDSLANRTLIVTTILVSLRGSPSMEQVAGMADVSSLLISSILRHVLVNYSVFKLISGYRLRTSIIFYPSITWTQNTPTANERLWGTFVSKTVSLMSKFQRCTLHTILPKRINIHRCSVL